MSDIIPSWCWVGAKVVCIDNGPDAPGHMWIVASECPDLGAVYTVSRVFLNAFTGNANIDLLELGRRSRLDGADVGYALRRFRPLISQADDLEAHFSKLLLLDAPLNHEREEA